MSCLTFEGKITIFKTLAISRIVFLSLISKVPTKIINELKRIQKTFLCPSKPKKKKMKPYALTLSMVVQKTLIYKQQSLHSFWVRRLFDNFFHEWKVIPLKPKNILWIIF